MEEAKKLEKEEDKKVAKKESSSSTSRTTAASNYIYSLNGKGQALPEETQHFLKKR
ncbi:hypothetical protein AHMF7616_01266 [Adhaeribacter pallidiroseus]|uniref:Uncharacterized protein n=1 Tax=Adhaeribacter pallidiroseus TaxID=2072847 RepID=A0A369QE27_9BACT|nr:hypothetical protein AHMF7616_01266 [Adhaeribacter pallidiroseus]